MTLAAETSPLLGLILGVVTTALGVTASLVAAWLTQRQKRREQSQAGEQFTWQRMRDLLEDTRASLAETRVALEESRKETADVRAELELNEERCKGELIRLRQRLDQLEGGKSQP